MTGGGQKAKNRAAAEKGPPEGPPTPRGLPEAGPGDRPSPKPSFRKALARSWRRVDKFWLGTGLCLFLGLGLGLFAFVAQARQKRLFERQSALETEVAALASGLRKHASLPFRPSRAYLKLLGELARTRQALDWLANGEGNPDADRQSFLEGELAELMGAYGRERPAARDEAGLEALRATFLRATTGLEHAHKASGLPAAVWAAELTQALAAVGLRPEVLTGFEARLASVKTAAQGLEEALGIAFLDARHLQQPGCEMVAFRPDPKRITVNGGGWEASGIGQEEALPRRTLSYSVEGTALVHRLLNVGTWRSLAHLESTPQGRIHCTIDTLTVRVSEHGSRDAEAVPVAARQLEQAWKALNPLAVELVFAQAERKAFDDIMVQLEPDLKAGTPDGKPDLDLWPTEGEIASLKDYFGEKDDLVVLRFPHEGGFRLQVLARAGFTYTDAGLLEDGHLIVLPGGMLLRLGEQRVPGPTGPRAFKAIQVLERPRATRLPSPQMVAK
ncbi:MAG: hypothetical protein HYZ13_01115 [Acidobacteria bacterium]|nr:hypothetical protein [Acidobacteriota bacterium]